jgi:hypothetical protein
MHQSYKQRNQRSTIYKNISTDTPQPNLFISPPSRHPLRRTLRVPVILLLASTLGTSRRAGIPIAAALAPERRRAATVVVPTAVVVAAAVVVSTTIVVPATIVASTAGAGDRPRPGDLVLAPAVVGVTLGVVDADDDTRVVGRVGAGEADRLGGREVARAGDLDLGALHVELGAAGEAGRVQRQQLDAHQVVAGRDALRHGEVVPAVVADHLVDGPDAARQALLGNLEPPQAVGGGGRGVVDLGEVDLDRAWGVEVVSYERIQGVGREEIYLWELTLVRSSDRVIRVTRERGPADLVLPPGADGGAGGDLDDGAVAVLDVGVAGKVGVVDVLDGVVARGSADALELALVDAVNRHALEDGVAADGRRQSDE